MNKLFKNHVLGMCANPKLVNYIQGIHLNNLNKTFKLIFAKDGIVKHIYEGYYELFEDDILILQFTYEIDINFAVNCTEKLYNIDPVGSPYSKTTNGLISIKHLNISLKYLIINETFVHSEFKTSHTTIRFSDSPFQVFKIPEMMDAMYFYTNFKYSKNTENKDNKKDTKENKENKGNENKPEHKSVTIEKDIRKLIFGLIDSDAYKKFARVEKLIETYSVDRNIPDDILLKYAQHKPPAFENTCLLSLTKNIIFLGKIEELPRVNKLVIKTFYIIDKGSVMVVSPFNDLTNCTVTSNYYIPINVDSINSHILEHLSDLDHFKNFINIMLDF